jgi:hypothetical protein
MVRIQTDLPHTSSRREIRAQWRAPLGLYADRHRQTPELPRRGRALAGHPPSACSAVKGPDRRRRDEERPFPAPNKEPAKTKNKFLDRRSPIQVRIHLPPAESPSLVRIRLRTSRTPAFPRGCARARVATRSAETRTCFVDGFLFHPSHLPGGLDDFVALVIPEPKPLQRVLF